MKNPNPITQSAAEHEKLIRADEREKVLALYGKTLTKIYDHASAILQLSAGFQPPSSVVARDSDATFATRLKGDAPKRKAVTANVVEEGQVRFALNNVRPPSTAMTIKQLRGACEGIGPKTIGAALRQLKDLGEVEAVARGKWKTKPADNGVANEVAASDGN